MAPLRLTLLFLTFIALTTFLTFLSLVRTHPPGNAATESFRRSDQSAFRTLFSFRSPSSLFPPSAIISLTDDNSTFFLARPADFGPALIEDGLSGQLWVGSGFGIGGTRRSEAASEAEGELGCSDVPDWSDRQRSHGSNKLLRQEVHQESGLTGSIPPSDTVNENIEHALHNDIGHHEQEISNDPRISQGDGTDDHLNPIPTTRISLAARGSQSQDMSGAWLSAKHADIESLQEAAEITGKIALLSRGGCGFLEKIKWAQRRGAAAVIVGDDTRGGALVTMFARGDTSNITIPSLFTSRTTAHLLSSLIPPEGNKNSDEGAGKPQDDPKGSQPHPLRTRDISDSKIKDDKWLRGQPQDRSSRPLTREHIPDCDMSWASSWKSRLFGKTTPHMDDSRRPPSSGRLHWVNEQWDEESFNHKPKISADTPKKTSSRRKSSTSSNTKDSFEIGVQDWRDPDLISTSSGILTASTSPTIAANPSFSKPRIVGKETLVSTADNGKQFSGGSIMPGSGQYGSRDLPRLKEEYSSTPLSHPEAKISDDERSACHSLPGQEQVQQGWLSKMFEPSPSRNLDSTKKLKTQLRRRDRALGSPHKLRSGDSSHHDFTGEHRGLWVTLTPTTVSTTPFFDTLLVLVVSPLITLTVVYAMLLLRSRIRRRRWRAPKSVVDRLPVRTYHTMTPSSASSSSIHASPNASSPTSPLLQSTSPYLSSRQTTRSRSNSEMCTTTPPRTPHQSHHSSQPYREGLPRHSKPRSKYQSRQIECVVCLEEYEEGRSKVMSLPCGHEFHADCM